MGRVFKPSYKATLPDGSTEVREARWWYIEYWNASGKQMRKKAAPTKAVAEEILRQKENEVAQEKNGLPTQNAGDLSLEKLKDRYLQAVKGRVIPEHWNGIQHRLNQVLLGTKSVVMRDLKPERMETFLSEMEARDPRPAPRTLNTYLQAIKAMLNWAVTSRMIPFNPLSPVLPRSEREKFVKRRPLTEEEVARLLEIAPTAPLLRRQAKAKRRVPLRRQAELLREGEQFTLVWRILIYTGLRFGELDALRWDDLDLEAGSLHVRAETAKSGKSATLPLPGHLVRALQAWRAKTQGKPGEGVVALPRNLARRLVEDLTSAGIPYVDEAGRKVDAHALRHTFGTLMSRHADPKTLQALMRHSSSELTFRVYVHLSQTRMREAVEAMPEPRQAPTTRMAEAS